MKKLHSLKLILLAAIVVVVFQNCGSKTKAKPLSEILKTVFYAKNVKHDGTVVYTKGAASNTEARYSKMKLDMSTGTSVSFTDFDGTTFVGTYVLSTDAKTLTLSGLTPSPTGANGTIVFTVTSFTEKPAELVLTRSGASAKTGNTVNTYTLETTP